MPTNAPTINPTLFHSSLSPKNQLAKTTHQSGFKLIISTLLLIGIYLKE
jgi:hypothetical protein